MSGATGKINNFIGSIKLVENQSVILKQSVAIPFQMLPGYSFMKKTNKPAGKGIQWLKNM